MGNLTLTVRTQASVIYGYSQAVMTRTETHVIFNGDTHTRTSLLEVIHLTPQPAPIVPILYTHEPLPPVQSPVKKQPAVVCQGGRGHLLIWSPW